MLPNGKMEKRTTAVQIGLIPKDGNVDENLILQLNSKEQHF